MQYKYIYGCHNWDSTSCSGRAKGTDMQGLHADISCPYVSSKMNFIEMYSFCHDVDYCVG